MRYRLVVYATADILTNLPGVALEAPLGDLVEIFIRVPVQQRARFEALLAMAMAAPDEPLWQRWAELPTDADPPLTPGPATADSRTHHEPDQHHRPDQQDHDAGADRRGRGGGGDRAVPAGAAGLRAGHGVYPDRVAGRRGGRPAHDAGHDRRGRGRPGGSETPKRACLAHLIRLLSSKLTAEGLLNEGSQLFQPGGVTDTVTLPVPGGKEHITFRVTVDRSAQPQRTSRIAKAKVELMPAGFAGVKGDDELSSGWGWWVRFVGQLKIKHPEWVIGWAGKGGYGSARDVKTEVGASGFQIHAMLYSGPARTFDYGATYHLSVDVEVKKRLIGRPKTWVKAGWARLMGKPRHRPASRASAEDKQLHGSTRFIMAEPSAPTTQPTPQEIARTGRVEVISPDRRAELVHELTHDHTPVNADDLLADLLGSKALADQIEEMLVSKGIGRFDARELTLWSTNVTQLEGMQVRGPSEQHPSMVIKGTVVNTHVDVWLESFPVNTRDVGDPYTFMKMDVAEGGPIVTSAKEKRRVWTWGLSFCAPVRHRRLFRHVGTHRGQLGPHPPAGQGQGSPPANRPADPNPPALPRKSRRRHLAHHHHAAEEKHVGQLPPRRLRTVRPHPRRHPLPTTSNTARPPPPTTPTHHPHHHHDSHHAARGAVGPAGCVPGASVPASAQRRDRAAVGEVADTSAHSLR